MANIWGTAETAIGIWFEIEAHWPAMRMGRTGHHPQGGGRPRRFLGSVGAFRARTGIDEIEERKNQARRHRLPDQIVRRACRAGGRASCTRGMNLVRRAGTHRAGGCKLTQASRPCLLKGYRRRSSPRIRPPGAGGMPHTADHRPQPTGIPMPSRTTFGTEGSPATGARLQGRRTAAPALVAGPAPRSLPAPSSGPGSATYAHSRSPGVEEACRKD